MAVSICCYLTKYQAKHLLPFHDTKLKQFCVDTINWKWVIKLNIKRQKTEHISFSIILSV